MADNTRPTAELFFELDSARLGAGSSDRLADLVAWSAHHPFSKIVLDGNADSTGSDVYNVGLSSRRTDSVQAKLIAMGVPAARIFRGIYGEHGARRASDGEDRRVTVWSTEQTLSSLIEESLVRGTALLWNLPVIAAEMDRLPTTIVAGL